jgi:hypothetical protein
MAVGSRGGYTGGGASSAAEAQAFARFGKRARDAARRSMRRPDHTAAAANCQPTPDD